MGPTEWVRPEPQAQPVVQGWPVSPLRHASTCPVLGVAGGVGGRHRTRAMGRYCAGSGSPLSISTAEKTCPVALPSDPRRNATVGSSGSTFSTIDDVRVRHDAYLSR